MKWILLTVVLTVIPAVIQAQVTAASCNTADVQTAINTATQGQTVTIPSCPSGVNWTSGVTISGKGINVQGAGSGRIVAINTAVLTIATGTLSLTIQSARADGTYPLGPNVTQTLRVFQVATRQNWMQGTVTSFNSGTGALVMNITSTSGTSASPQQHHWGIATVPQTVISNNATGATPMFNIFEDTAFHTSVSGIKFLQGTTTQPGAYDIGIQNTVGGQAVLVHDCWMEAGAGSAQIESGTNRGVVWDCSFDATPFAQGGTVNSALNVVLPPSSALSKTSWNSASLWGAQDTTGQGNFYFETNDVHAYLVTAGTDDGGRLNYRYNFMDNAGFAVHGADSSPGGNRYFDFNNNLGIFGGYSDGFSTLNMQNWILIRGGSMLVWNNALPDIVSGDGGQKANIVMAVWNLQWNINNNHCWGSGFTTPGQYYPVPRQIGRGYTTGTSTANYPPDGVTNSTTDTTGYFIGDVDPVYIWNNSGGVGGFGGNSYSLSDGLNIGNNCPAGYDSVVNYAVLNRDFFIGAKPGYTAFTYPHPLTASVFVSPGAINFGTITQFSSSSPQTVTVTNNSGSTITLTGTTLSGTNASDFSLSSNSCNSGTVTNTSTCTVNVTFTPTAAPTTNESGILNIAFTGASGSPSTVSLLGTSGSGSTPHAGNPVCTPGTGTYNTTQNVTCTNPSSAPVLCQTQNGATPVTNGVTSCTVGTVVSGTIPVIPTGGGTQLLVVAGGTGFLDSTPFSGVYTLPGGVGPQAISGGVAKIGGVAVIK